jgi:hypothetical protein
MIHFTPWLMDTGGPLLLVIVFGGIGLALLPVLFIVEGLAMFALKWGSAKRCLLDAVYMNLASTLLGLFAACGLLSNMLHLDTQGSLLFILITWTISVVVEGAILALLKRHPPRQTWLTAMAVNTISYALLVLLVVLADRGGLRF